MKSQEKCGGANHVHVLLFPCPLQGHVNSMLHLAELLALSEIHVTFLNTEHIHNRLTRFGDIQALSARCPTLQFKTISDGLTADDEHHPGFGDRDRIYDVTNSINLHVKPLLRQILVSESPRVTCFIADGFFGGLTADVANEIGIQLIHFRPISFSCFWAYFCVPTLFQCNELPIRGDEDMDRDITNIPGMENLLRCRDLPSFCRGTDTDTEPSPLKSIVSETHQTLQAGALIFNTFEDLEGSVLSQISFQFPHVYTLGPLHAHLKTRRRASKTKTTSSSEPAPPSSTNSLWKVDRSCIAWLDSQPLKSVIYVSFGSITVMTREEFIEIWYGLVNSKKRFLWVMRPDMVTRKDGDDRIPAELEEGTKERGFVVGWAPQEEVLAHHAIGGFLTHSGWNSTLESVVAGVPMICWPYFGDQQINSRLVSEVWKVGLDMKDGCDRNIVEKMVNDLMVHRREEFLRSTQALSALANNSVSHGGSSYSNLDRLIQYLKSISQKNH